ncbi:electron transport complex subunit RsxD [Arhodomonas sp. AD133]|uniref:electron transport complex subunit RsxD n=1 Tax=Arhodomonas sp. AD133 TaxID=3415009 RepID=UPI003EC059F2
MPLRQAVSPHLRPPTTVAGTMRAVLYALVPGIIALIGFFGMGVVWQLLLGVTTAVATEAAMLRLRGRPLKQFLNDWSAVVTGVLLAVAIPPIAPWWLIVVGTAFALVFAKHLYGGLGYNPFNPAMVGYVVLLIAFPQIMTHWAAPAGLGGSAPGPLTSLQVILGSGGLDGITAATPLDQVKTELGLARTLAEIRQGELWGVLGGRGWSWVNLLFLAGGLGLIATRVIGWRIPVGVLAGIVIPAAVHWSADPSTHPGAWFHLVSGGTMLGAFFIATDPVSAATTPRGRLIYGTGIGALTWLIRTYGGYPDGIAFAVLLMNMAAPMIDAYTRPRVYGHRRERGGGPS